MKIAQSTQRTAGPERRLSPAAQDVRSSPAARVSRKPLPTSLQHTQTSSTLCRGAQGIAPGVEQLSNNVRNSELQMHQHPRQSSAVAGPQDLNSAHHSTNSVRHRSREPEGRDEPIRGPLQQLRPILPAPNRQRMPSELLATPALHLPPIQSPQGQAALPQLEQLTSLLRTAPPSPTRTPLPEAPAQGDRFSVPLKPAVVPLDDPSSRASGVSTTTARLTSCTLDDSDAPGNSSWSLTLSNRLLNLLAKYSKNSHPRPDDFKNAQNLYLCPVCKREFARLKFFTRHLFEKH